MGFPRQEYWSGLPCPPPGDLPSPEFEPRFPASQADYLPLSHQGRPLFPRPGSKLVSSRLPTRFLATGSPGKSLAAVL